MEHSEQGCQQYQHAIELIGKRWTGLVIMVLLDGPQRFGAIAEQLGGVSDRMLSERLKELESEGMIERRVYAEMPVRIEYRLTRKGAALAPVIEAVQQWSRAWPQAEAEPEEEAA